MSKLIIVGATGYIGKYLYENAIKKLSVRGTSSYGLSGMAHLQLNSPIDFDFSIIQPQDVILIIAAISSPDICAREYDRAWAVNVTATSELITRATERGGKVIFFSSDTIYGERNDVFDESSKSQPSGEYAEMKSEIENKFLGNPLFKTVRLSYVFSREDKFTKYLSECAERGEEVELFHPFFRAFVHRDDVVEGVLALATRWEMFPQQVINFGGPEVLSRVDLAECLKDVVFPNLKFRVTDPGEEFFRKRPRIIAMTSNILSDLLGRRVHSLAEAVEIEFTSSKTLNDVN